MTIAYYCVLLAAIFPYACVTYAKATRAYLTEGGNKEPREYAADLEGARRRAYSAHLNSFEVFGPFAAAVIIASVAGAAAAPIDALAAAFIIFRVIYAFCYIFDYDKARSAAWMLAMACICGLFFLAARA